MRIPTPLSSTPNVNFEFHISRAVREQYDFDQSIFTLNGNVILADFQAARIFTQKLNSLREKGQPAFMAGQVNAMGLIDEILHLVLGLYKQQIKPAVMAEALDWIYSRLGKQAVDQALATFCIQFPALTVYRREQSEEQYFNAATDSIPNTQIILEEMLMLWLANANPAFRPYALLFDDTDLQENTVYSQIIEQLDQFFNYQPTFGPHNQQLIAMLRSPAKASPDSLIGQLDYIRTHWSILIGEFLHKLLSSMDLITEEEIARFGIGPGPAEVYDFHAWGLGDAPEQFSEDSDWMPRLVLLAKNAYVWLDQLSRQYQRQITRLDQIPEEELDRLANQGISGLWLIGLWRRSNASRRIKQMMGDPDAIASAYSLDDYQIAEELGGSQAIDNLRQRAIRRGIRLGGDMVPNHMAIDSRWVFEHPHWFLGLDHSPFPGYSFNGPNLSGREDIGIYLEDKYYNRSDAAVVFKRVNFWTGEERYIYHGNDGTSMPWNDTAQLDFTKPEVREGVIQTILHVAWQFPIIRFDAAMTLAKKHIQRLWFPLPGSGGAIPSRAGHGMTAEEFESAIPKEFWREVVDRVAQEVPDTLLLAEAFWMMEGYFVRTLGMHRVYNSAFMHMLRDEDNAKYRDLIKKTLEYNPQILRRYVNFMNNPDEETAVEQFGKGDKYFGIATLMATLPGLPMVGHGQIEGYSEKYGMEYKRAKWQEQPDHHLVERHARQIFPLFHQRRLFAGVENFLLYDFYSASGHVNEDVFAYSNQLGDRHSLVIYHNRFGDTRGWIKTSAAYLDQSSSEKSLIQRNLGQGLSLPNDPNAYVIFRNLVTGKEYIRNCAEVHEDGIFMELLAYQTYVFLDFRVVFDSPDGSYNRVNAYLGGQPADSVELAMQEMFLQVIHNPYRELVNAGMVRYLVASRRDLADERLDDVPLDQVEQKGVHLLREAARFLNSTPEIDPIAALMRTRTGSVLNLPVLDEDYPWPRSGKYAAVVTRIQEKLDQDVFNWTALLIAVLTNALGEIASDESRTASAAVQGWIDEWMLRNVIRETFEQLPVSPAAASYGASLVGLLAGQFDWPNLKSSKVGKPLTVMTAWLADPAIRDFLRINTFNDVEWFNQEAIQTWLDWMTILGAVNILSDEKIPNEEVPKQLVLIHDWILRIGKAVSQADYQVEKLVKHLKGK
ncbi:MAG: alpha-amylase [Anaerolineales bacterium]|nr:alpha-amylase [Anaerolineales bacterium]